MRLLIVSLGLLLPAMGSAAPLTQSEYRWFVDLGGKTAHIVGKDKPLTGVRAGMVLPVNINIALEAYAMTEQAETQGGGNYQRQNSYRFFGAHLEYPHRIFDRLSVIPGLSAGMGLGTYETKNGDTVGTEEKIYYSLEPSVTLSVKVVKSMWLNIGVSYFLVGDEPGFTNATSLNLFARYLW